MFSCDRGRVYGSCPTTIARFLRVAVTYTHTPIGKEGSEGAGGVGWGGEGALSRRVTPKPIGEGPAKELRSLGLRVLYTLVEKWYDCVH